MTPVGTTIGDCYVSIFSQSGSLRVSELVVQTDPATGRVTRIDGIQGQASCPEITLTVLGYEDSVTAHIEFDQSHWLWEAYVVFTNSGPSCDSDITLHAECVGHPECSWDEPIHLSCGEQPQPGDCPGVTGSVNADVECINGQRPVFLILDFEPPLEAGATVSIFWAFGDGETLIEETSISSETASLNHLHRYDSGGPYSASAFVTVETAAASDCDAVAVSFPSFIAQPCGPTADCPVLTIDSLGPPPCATVGARVTAQASLDPAPSDPDSVEFTWSIRAPSGRRWQRQVTLPSMDTGLGIWQDAETLTDSVVLLNETGTYEIVVTAEVPNTPEGCSPSDSVTFELPDCDEDCPSVELEEPDVTGCGKTAVIELHADLDPPAPAGTQFNWTVQLTGALQGQRTTTVPEARSSDTWTHTDGTFGPLRVQAGDMTATVTVVLPNQIETCPVPTDSVTFEVEACSGPPKPPKGPDDSGTGGCGFLYWIGLALLIIGSVLAFGGGCTPNPVIIGIGSGAAILGAFFLIMWALFCVQVAGCRALQRLIGFINALIALFAALGIALAIVAAILAALGLPPVNAGCIGAAFTVAGYLAVVNLIFFWIFLAKPCQWEGDNPFFN